jgi:hypothetical protein
MIDFLLGVCWGLIIANFIYTIVRIAEDDEEN